MPLRAGACAHTPIHAGPRGYVRTHEYCMHTCVHDILHQALAEKRREEARIALEKRLAEEAYEAVRVQQEIYATKVFCF